MQVPITPITILDTPKECGSVTLTANGGKSYEWNGGQNTTSAINTVTTTGIYSVTATDQNGCKTIALKNVPTIPKTVLKTTVNKTICQGESYSGYSSSGTYIDSLTSTYGCDSIRTLNLSVLATPTIKLDNNKIICNGQAVELTPSMTSTNLPYTYKWSTNETTPSILAKSAGVYSVTVVNGTCSSVASTSVTVNPPPTILPNETRTCDDNVLVAGGLDSNLSYLWEHAGETTPTITVHEPGTYTVKITNAFNCSAVRTIQITGSCLTNVFAPDSFTPNQDQMNDTFKLFVKNGTQLGLTIYNRWGDVLYSESGATAQWDGKYKGDDCLTGMYGYKLTYKASGSNEVLEHKGTVLLVR
ncbi:gliding motility-associated C-terminal domain-containing protein [Spirosoma telluris]